jgi:hypothetical protein
MRLNVIWLLIRFVVVAAMTAVIWTIPAGYANLDWAAAVLIGAIVSVALYVWLGTIRNKSGIEWSAPLSMQTPFLPMNRFPLRFWFVNSYALIIAGSVVMARELLEHSGHEAVAGTFVVLGLYIFVALKLSTRSNHLKHG